MIKMEKNSNGKYGKQRNTYGFLTEALNLVYDYLSKRKQK